MMMHGLTKLIYYLILLATSFDPAGSSSGLHYEPINVKKLPTSLVHWFIIKA
jgi:hypothetical protein